jgi:hypothetical protein
LLGTSVPDTFGKGPTGEYIKARGTTVVVSGRGGKGTDERKDGRENGTADDGSEVKCPASGKKVRADGCKEGRKNLGMSEGRNAGGQWAAAALSKVVVINIVFRILPFYEPTFLDGTRSKA